jgi:hypothetical protein
MPLRTQTLETALSRSSDLGLQICDRWFNDRRHEPVAE